MCEVYPLYTARFLISLSMWCRESLAVYINRLYSLSNTTTTSVTVCYTTPEKFQTIWFTISDFLRFLLKFFTFLLTAYNKLPLLYTASGQFLVLSHRLYRFLSNCNDCNYDVITLYTRGFLQYSQSLIVTLTVFLYNQCVGFLIPAHSISSLSNCQLLGFYLHHTCLWMQPAPWM